MQGLADCSHVQELAILRYDGASEEDPQENEDVIPTGVLVNPWNEAASDTAIPIVQMNATGTLFLGTIFNEWPKCLFIVTCELRIIVRVA